MVMKATDFVDEATEALARAGHTKESDPQFDARLAGAVGVLMAVWLLELGNARATEKLATFDGMRLVAEETYKTQSFMLGRS
jgi:hypothetical protein